VPEQGAGLLDPAGAARSSRSTRRWQSMQYRAKGSASSRLSVMASPHRSQFPNEPSSIFCRAATTSRSSRRSPLPSSKKNSRV
jgi:hypothetical protein